MIYRSTLFTRLVRHLSGRVSGWVEARDSRRAERFMQAAFPAGSRVVLTGKCCLVSQRQPGAMGTVLSANIDANDYRVKIDGDADRFQYVCSTGMRLQ